MKSLLIEFDCWFSQWFSQWLDDLIRWLEDPRRWWFRWRYWKQYECEVCHKKFRGRPKDGFYPFTCSDECYSNWLPF